MYIYNIFQYIYIYINIYILISFVNFHILHVIHQLFFIVNYQRDIEANRTNINLTAWNYSVIGKQYEPKGNRHIYIYT